MDRSIAYLDKQENFTFYKPGVDNPPEISGWWDECMSWHTGCYVHTALNPFHISELSGPGAKAFFEKYIVNTMNNFPIGRGKHAIFCNDEGKIVRDGILVRMSEDTYRGFCLNVMDELWEQEKDNYDAVYTNLKGKIMLFQLCGPRSLELTEAVTGQDLHALPFIHCTECTVDGRQVWILRAGMAGYLGYEIHCHVEDFTYIYDKIMEKGMDYGLKQLGLHSYRNTHTEGGFAQASIHYWYAGYDHEADDLLGQRNAPRYPARFPDVRTILYDGSLSDQPYKTLYRTPTECGWSRMVKFDHDFIGRAALEKEAAMPPRVMMSLEWNAEDVADVWASLLSDGEPYKRMDFPEDRAPFETCQDKLQYLLQDRILKDGKTIGISSGRAYSPYYRKMISLATIDSAYAKEGTEVTILWGNPGTRQKEIRATVARFPYVDSQRNEQVDTAEIPSGIR